MKVLATIRDPLKTRMVKISIGTRVAFLKGEASQQPEIRERLIGR
jgi:hypothetical protein